MWWRRALRRLQVSRKVRTRDETGAEIVEFAILVPVLILILCGLLDFGLMFGGHITLERGVNAGARAASLNASTSPPNCTGGPNAYTAAMVCNVVSDIGTLMGVKTTSLVVGICFAPQGGALTSLICNAETSTSVGTSVYGDVEVCAQASLQSTTGFTAPFMNGKASGTSSRLTVEQPQPSAATNYDAYNAASPPVQYNGITVAGMGCS